jgi:hypothetical protein
VLGFFSALSLVCTLVLVSPAVCLAQEQDSASQQPLAAQEQDTRYQELLVWLEAYHQWEEWILKWGNKIAYNAAGGIVKDRPARPEPPAWVWDDCRMLLDAEGKLGEACDILSRWDNLAQLILSKKHVGGLTNATDIVPKTSFLQRIHLTGGWVPAQLPAPKVYLVAGMQVGIVEVGRATLPSVGVGLVAVSDGAGGYEWKPATVIGIGYRLTSFGFPWINREANLHINVARATIHAARNMPIGLDPSQNLIGFSLTFAKR